MPEIGIFLVPGAAEPETTVAQAIAADEALMIGVPDDAVSIIRRLGEEIAPRVRDATG